MKRFTLGHHVAAGWIVLDARNMSVAYFNANREEEAAAYVEARNVIDNIRTQRDRDEANAMAEFKAGYERRGRNAA